jgi:hypothetical protein
VLVVFSETVNGNSSERTELLSQGRNLSTPDHSQILIGTQTAFVEKCRAWYKVNKAETGRIAALWPGKLQFTKKNCGDLFIYFVQVRLYMPLRLYNILAGKTSITRGWTVNPKADSTSLATGILPQM